jgi:excisionase family DNA binding protein
MLMTIKEIAEKFRVSKMTVYRLVHEGEVAATRIGRSYRVDDRDVDAYLKRQRTAGPGLPETEIETGHSDAA